jgi:spoIIIJ-associated protein
MEEYVEFSGKDVDDAIANACRHFGLEREKLEIEIVSGGSSGIFGLVGVKKARILAQKRTTIEKIETPNNHGNAVQTAAHEPKPAKKQSRAKSQPKPVPKAELKDELETDSTPETEIKEPPKTGIDKVDLQAVPEDPGTDDPELRQYIHGLLIHLTEPLCPNAKISVNDQTKPISVTIKDETTTDILIGRDGQTLSAIQYIANRIIAKNRPGAARVQLDTEDFLEKQNEELQQSAFELASKAKKIGKTMSTRPLSSYHRRIVHMALQNDKKIRTKSKGDGPMKRVLIMPKQRRKKPSQE